MKKSILLFFVLSLLVFFSCENGPGSKDDIIVPTCSFCADVPDSIQLGDQLTITIEAKDVDGQVAKVDFELDTNFLLSDSVAPYSYTWNSEGAEVGEHTFKATVFDNDGNTAEAKKSVVIDKKPREWTILGYFAGNNNLDYGQGGTSYLINDLQEMEKAGSSDQVTSLVMLSSQRAGGSAKYYLIEKHDDHLPDQILSPAVVDDLGTKDMSDPKTLKEFIKWGVENYPAEHYALIMNSHGGGWYGICPEDNTGEFMNLYELREALEANVEMDAIIFHSCLMGMTEVAYEIKDCAEYMVACQSNMPVLSVLAADVWLNDLIEKPTIEAKELSKSIAKCVYDRSNAAQLSTPIAVTDLSKIGALGSDLSILGNRLLDLNHNCWDEISSAWYEANFGIDGYSSFTDLGLFIRKLLESSNDITKIELIKSAAIEIKNTLNDAVPFYWNPSDFPAYGLSIHFPGISSDLDETHYNELKFEETKWITFLKEFVENNAYGNKGKAYFSGSVNWPGHTLSSHCKLSVYYFDSDDEFQNLGTIAVGNDGDYSAVITSSSWPKLYYIFVHDDIDDDGIEDAGEGIGFWDYNNDDQWTTVDKLVLYENSDISGVNITLSTKGNYDKSIDLNKLHDLMENSGFRWSSAHKIMSNSF